MYKKTLFRSTFQILLFVCFFSGSAWAQSILIFSTSHNNTGPTVVTEASGVMKLVVSTFSPIREIRINGETQNIEPVTESEIELPLNLNEGDNRIVIRVITEKTEQQKQFVINYTPPLPGTEDATKVKPFQLITVAGINQSDNITGVKEDKQSASKLSLTVIPQYSLELSPASELRFQGILMREKISDTKLEAYETVFTQIDAKFMNKAGFGDWQIIAGANDIGGKTSGMSADTEIEQNLFLGGSIQLEALDNKNVSLGLKYTMRNAEDPAFKDYDRDGTLLTVNAGWKRTFGNLAGTFAANYDFNDAKGAYNDYSAYSLSVGGKYPIGKALTVGADLNTQSKTFNENDPLKGEKEALTLVTISVGGSYAFSSLKGFFVLGDLTTRQQSSNVDANTYTENTTNLSLIYIF